MGGGTTTPTTGNRRRAGRRRWGSPDPWWPAEDAIDAQVRADLAGVPTVGVDGPRRFAVTRDEALAALAVFLRDRLPAFGAHEDAMLAGDGWMSHSLLSVPLNLGLLDPLEVVQAAEAEYRAGRAPLAAIEGFIRQVLGWREYMWHLYWWLPADYRERNVFGAREPLPGWWQELQGSGARCLDVTMQQVRETGWAHHIQRLMVLGSWALQRGYDPAELTDWFHRVFVDGYDWVMLGNVVGMSQYADGGVVATKPYTSGGAYIKRMSDYCTGCRFRPQDRTGERACPFTAGYWDFLARNEAALANNHRMKQPLAGMRRLRRSARGEGDCRAVRTGTLDRQQHLAEVAGVREQTVCFGGVGQREHPVDDRADRPGPVQRPHVAHHGLADLRLLRRGSGCAGTWR